MALLERLSLVDFGNREAVRRLEEAVDFARPLAEVGQERRRRSLINVKKISTPIRILV